MQEQAIGRTGMVARLAFALATGVFFLWVGYAPSGFKKGLSDLVCGGVLLLLAEVAWKVLIRKREVKAGFVCLLVADVCVWVVVSFAFNEINNAVTRFRFEKVSRAVEFAALEFATLAKQTNSYAVRYGRRILLTPELISVFPRDIKLPPGLTPYGMNDEMMVSRWGGGKTNLVYRLSYPGLRNGVVIVDPNTIPIGELRDEWPGISLVKDNVYTF